jgi:hypothetical protein
MGATRASISSGLNPCPALSAALSKDPGNARTKISTQLNSFLGTASMFFSPYQPIGDDCAESYMDFFTPHT